MGDLFSTFNPNVGLMSIQIPLNWVSSTFIILFFPQLYWLIKRKGLKFTHFIIRRIFDELKVVLGGLIRPGRGLLFLSLFFFILFSNILGLVPYVFTASSHLSFTLALSLPLWLGRLFTRLTKQFNKNMAHLVPEGTPPPLIPLMVLIESIRTVIRPFTLAVRLSANIIAGHLLLRLLGGRAANLSLIPLSALIAALLRLILLERAVACIQAYVFTILSTLYLREHTSKELVK